MRNCTFLMYNIRNNNMVKIGYDISGEIVPWVRYLWLNRTQGTISPEKSYPVNLGTISLGYDFSWVRFLLTPYQTQLISKKRKYIIQKRILGVCLHINVTIMHI